MKKSLGGDRLGSGAKMDVELHGYQRSTHDLGYLWRSTMAAGPLVPFMSQVALPGDTFDINLDVNVKTHPTIGPLFGSYKVQADIFICPIRLYHGKLHNNTLGIGRKMSEIKLPQIRMWGIPVAQDNPDRDNSQINPSCILSYLGIRGVGNVVPPDTTVRARMFNAVPLLAYWDIYKNYYANKQEEYGAVINTPKQAPTTSIGFVVDGNNIPQYPAQTAIASLNGSIWYIQGAALPDLSTIRVLIDGQWYVASQLTSLGFTQDTALRWVGLDTSSGGLVQAWDYVPADELPFLPPTVELFPLERIDNMREEILLATQTTNPFIINDTFLEPYNTVAIGGGTPQPDDVPYSSPMQGLGLKTYQSDLFNNWLSTEWIDGPDGINTITRVSTAGGSFSIDTLNLSKKVYDMLNRIAVSGGSYDDWIDAVYTHDRFTRIETPVYMGGLSKELVFQEVVSNAAAETQGSSEQPLGTLAGKGVMANKHKGGKVYVKVDEPSYIMGIISITPRIDYSQGNSWDTHLATMDDFHKPALDAIGFQELIIEQMAWWTSGYDTSINQWVTRSAGKQPAWINYMTNVNKTYGNFAIQSNEMFMTLNRRYEYDAATFSIKDLTTYIDPTKFNNIFAQTDITAQNFWVQMAVDITARRKMSAKVIPNL